MFISNTIKYLLQNGFKNSFLLPVFYIGLLGGSGYLFYTGEPEAAAALTGTAVAAITVNKDDKDKKEENERIKSMQIHEFQEQLSDSKITIATLEERLLNNQKINKIQEELFEEKNKRALFEQEVRFLRQGSQQFRLPEGKNQPFDPKIEEKVAEVKKPPDDSNIK
ncbi:hypothetical protein [Nostoc sp.]|uniref:hypothetical protein n=1 Tax=Nostoc sp. TaxID=1180 RepID=UPI002FF87821